MAKLAALGAALLLVAFTLGVQGSLDKLSSLQLPSCSQTSADQPCNPSYKCTLFNGWFCNELIVWPHEHGVGFYTVGTDGFLSETAQLKSKCTSLFALPKVINGHVVLMHTRTASCNCPEPGVKPCPLQLSLRSANNDATGYIDFLEADRSKPVQLLTAELTHEMTLVDSGGSDGMLGCSSLINAHAVRGMIAVVYRGVCTYQTKFTNAVAAGAVAIIVVNTEGTGLAIMIASAQVPAMMISFEDGEKIRKALQSGASVTATYGPNTGAVVANPHAQPPSGLSTVSLDDIFQGGLVGAVPHTNAFQFTSGVVLFDAIRNHLWVLNPDFSTNTIKIFSLDDGFTNPTKLADLSVPFVDALGGTFFSHGNQRYLAVARSAAHTEIWDVSDVTKVAQLSTLSTLGAGAPSISPDSNFLFVSNVSNGVTKPNLLIWNIQDPRAPFLINTINEDFATIGARISDVTVQGDHMWVTWGSDGISVYGISDPTNPTKLGLYDPTSAFGD